MPKHYTQQMEISGKDKDDNDYDTKLTLWAVTPAHNHGSANEFTKQGKTLITNQLKGKQKVKSVNIKEKKFMSNQNKPTSNPLFQIKHNKKQWVVA